MGKALKRDTLDDVVKYYQANDEDQRLEVQQLEFVVTAALMKRYLKPASRILELGAGTGRYTGWLAGEGHQITAVELVPELAARNTARLQKAGLENKAEVLVGDAREVVRRFQGPFDAILAMGPLYHLVSLEERTNLMTSLAAATRRNGLVVTAHLTRIGLLGYMLTRYPIWGLQSPKQVDQILMAGHLWDHPRNGEFRGYFSSLDEIKDLHESQGLEIIGVHSQDPCIGSVDEIFSQLPPELKAAWADILVRLSHDPLALGSGRSLLCISKK